MKEIPGFSDYFATECGEIWSKKSGTLKKMKLALDRYGYRVIGIRDDSGVKRHIGVHRHVLSTFVGPCPAGMQACHNNSVRDDNRLENLRWDTLKGNMKDRTEAGLWNPLLGECHQNSKLTESDVIEIVRRLSLGETQVAVSRDFNVKRENISAIWTGKTWSHVTGVEYEAKGHNGKLTDKIVIEIFNRVKSGELPSSVAKDYPVNFRHIYKIMQGRAWSRVTGVKKVAP